MVGVQDVALGKMRAVVCPRRLPDDCFFGFLRSFPTTSASKIPRDPNIGRIGPEP